jgi:TolA-binding protein
MAPKAMSYKANSVIYFQGDISDKIYILKAGRLSLNSIDIETGQEIHDPIQTGEFFGVKSAMGKYSREENAVVLSDSQVITFSVPEFEQLVYQNTRIIMKMLKVFSNQLRRMHKRVRNLLAMEEQQDPETGLFKIGEYYLTNKLYPQAIYTFSRYLTYYPSGSFHQEATRNIESAESMAQKYGIGKGPAPAAQPASSSTNKPTGGKQLSDVAKQYYNAVSLFSQQDYGAALKEFQQIADSGGDPEYTLKSRYELGRCLYSLKKHDECIKHFTELIQKFPKLPDLPDALFIVGQSYKEKGANDKALGFFKKILSMTSEGDSIQRKVKKSMRDLEEKS